jgi:hypothetical protein
LQNAIIPLFKENAHYRHLIKQARGAAVYLRKPGARAEIGGIYPAHYAIRWIYDYPLVRFLCKSYEQANALLARGGMELSPDVRLLIPLLQKVFDTMRVFEADDAPITYVVPENADLLSFLERQADWPDGVDVAKIYLDAIAIIRCACFSKTNSVFHLAYVLTPADRTRAQDTLLR